MFKKTLAWLLALMMLVCAMPLSVFAAETTDVAAIGNTGYATLQAAIEAATTGDTVTLLKDITLGTYVQGKTDAAVTINKAITLDGNGNTLTSQAGRAINVNVAGDVEIKNLTIKQYCGRNGDDQKRCINVITNTVNLKVTDCNLEMVEHYANGRTHTSYVSGVHAATGVNHNITIDGCNIKTIYGVVNYAAGTEIDIKNSNISNALYGVWINAVSTVNVENSTITTKEDMGTNNLGIAFLVQSAGVSVTADENTKINALAPKGADGTATGGQAFALYSSVKTADLGTIDLSDATINKVADTDPVIYLANAKAQINRANGTVMFDTLDEAIAALTITDDPINLESLDGTEFTIADVNEKLAELGRDFHYDENGKVVLNIKPVAQIGETKYETLQAAIDACKAGETIQLIDDIAIDGYGSIHVPKLTSNRNGKYNEAYGEGAIFYIYKNDVILDLNGHSITWDAHDEYYCDGVTTALFRVTVEGALKNGKVDTCEFTVKDTVGTGKVTIYGNPAAVYSTFMYATANIEGGTWTNYPCQDCKATGYFIYPSHGSTMNITGGTFQQVPAEGIANKLLGWQGSTIAGQQNYLCDYSKTNLNISGGTFVGFNPSEEVKFIDYGAGLDDNINGCADGYFAVNNGNDTWTVKKMDPVVIVNNVPYASWEEAMAANDTYAANNKFDVKNATIVLLADISYDAEFEHAFSGNTVINLNGHSFYAKRGIAMSDTVKIVGPGTFDAGNDSWPLSINGNVYLDPTAKFTGTLQFSSGKKGNLWIGNENALGSTGKYNTKDSDAFVRIIFRQGLEVLDFQYGRVTLTEDDATLDNQKVTIGANAIFTVAEGVVLGLNPSTELTLNGKVDGDGTVMVSSFEHLKQVINETEIKNIKLGADVSGIMTIGHNAADQVTIDLNGHTWSSPDVALNVFRAGTEVTLKNGTIKGNSTGGTVHVTYGGKLILGENLTVLSGSRANAISMDTGILEVAADANPQVIGGIGSVAAAGDTTNTINIASGFYDGDFVMNDKTKTTCVLTGGTYTLDVDPYCADDYMTKITTKDSNCYWTVVKAEPLFAIHGSNMNLGNSLDMNFFIDPVAVDNTLADEKEDKNHTAIVNAMNQTVKNWSVVITRIEKGGIAHTKTYTSDAWWYNKGAALMYVIYEDIAARNMTDTIYVQVFDANGTPVTAIWEDSVYNYANRIMKSTYDDAQNGDAKAKKRMTLMVDMLNYGAAAQKQFGYRLDALASDIDASYTSYATSNYESLGGKQSIQPENSTLYSDLYVGVSLGLTSDLKMGFAFDKSIMDLVNNHKHSITVTHTDYHGKEHKADYKSGYEFGTIESNDDIALVYYEEILVGDCNQIVTVTVKNDKDEAVLTIKDSVYYYVDRMGERVLPCGIPLLKFSQSARAYLGKAN